jgi:hypothetical protein
MGYLRKRLQQRAGAEGAVSSQVGGDTSCQRLWGDTTSSPCGASGPHSLQAEVWLAPFRAMVPPAAHARVEVGSWEVVSPREVCFTMAALSVVPLVVLDTPFPGMTLPVQHSGLTHVCQQVL